ncbi:MAG: molybdopterin-dependent oxidoreductase, partial [Alphaproteobacteria bacterium]|nr:molybdopterin-dependent oxidoreductase [Alphaproteobacteria bacterium]
MNEPAAPEWHKTACILCLTNCGLQVQLGGDDGRRIVRVKGDKDHPASKGYTCNKALQLDYYQNGRDRLNTPLRRRPDGTFEAIDWDTAIAEIAAGLVAIRDEFGGERIMYYGGGGQGNHLGGMYAGSLRRALGMKYRSNALAQEKTGQAWVNQRTLGSTFWHGDFHDCEVALFIGKNPWQSHGMQRARAVVRQIAKDEGRSLIVIDPRTSETAELADFHLAVTPGRDAWCLAALLAVIVQEGLADADWLAEHAVGLEEVVKTLLDISIADYAEIAGLEEDLIRRTARRIAAADGVAIYEDLGVQMSLNSTLNSYLDNLLFLLTGNLGRAGGVNIPTAMVPIFGTTKEFRDDDGAIRQELSPVTQSRIISDLVPCNVIPDEIVTDHPDRFRAMVVESSNPAHSLADSERMREALSALDLLVVIDVAMTETARLADYVLPAASQFEKWEATFFNFEFPRNHFHLRAPLLPPLPGTLAEPEIHSRLIEAIGSVGEEDLAPLRQAAAEGREAFAEAFFAAMAANPKVAGHAAHVLHRTLGPTLPEGAEAAAGIWLAAQLAARKYPESLARAGYAGSAIQAGNALFEAILTNPSGTHFSLDEPAESLRRVRLPDGKVDLCLPEMLEELRGLASGGAMPDTEGFPLVLQAGERRSYTAQTLIRDPGWLKSNNATALVINPADAAGIGVGDGGRARLSTRRGSVEVVVEVDPRMQPGHLSLPNGLGLSYPDADGRDKITGVAPNELTAVEDRDDFA